MDIYYDTTRTFIERLRGPSIASGMERVVHSWARSVSNNGGSLVTGLSRKWADEVIDSEPSFAWITQGSFLTGPERQQFPILRKMLRKSGRRQDLAWRAARAAAFRGAERASRKGIESLFKSLGQTDDFIYHCPLPEVLPDSLPKNCIPVINVYDIMPWVFRDTYSKTARDRFEAMLKAVKHHRGHIIVNSRDTKHSLVCFFNLDSTRIHVVPLGSDVSFNAETGARIDPTETGRPFLLYVAGSGQRRKNVAGTIRGFARFLETSGAEADLIIVGGGTDAFQDYANQLVPASKGEVRCLGQVDGETLGRFYEQARIGLYLSLYEGFGLPILEYMHRGLPVVCGDTTSLPEVAGSVAVMVDAMDAESVANGISSLWHDPGIREQAIFAGRARASEFTWENSSRCLHETYEKIFNISKGASQPA